MTVQTSKNGRQAMLRKKAGTVNKFGGLCFINIIKIIHDTTVYIAPYVYVDTLTNLMDIIARQD